MKIQEASGQTRRCEASIKDRRPPISRLAYAGLTGVSDPRARLGGIERQLLVRRLTAQLDKKLILLTAPAGYGKSHALRSLWDSLTDADCDRRWLDLSGAGGPDGFAAALIDACAPMSMDCAPARKASSPDEALSRLACRMREAARPLVVFLDEYHEIQGAEADRILKTFLQQTPPSVRVILAARSEPACGAAKLRLQGGLAEFDVDDLAFDIEEILELFRGEGLTRTDARRLAAKTQGWPAALGLTKLWMAREKVPARGAARFSGDHPLMENYFRQEVLAELSAEAQSFLISTALFSSFDAALIDAALSRQDGAIMMGCLRYLEGFIAPADPARRRFRHHPLLKEYLLSRVHELGDGEYLKAVHRRASGHFESAGEPLAALEHAIKAGGDERIQAIIDRSGFGAVALSSDARLFMHVMRRLDEQGLRETPRLILAKAAHRLRQGRLCDARALIDRARNNLGGSPPESLGADLKADLVLVEALYAVHADAPQPDGPAAALEDARPLFAALDPIDAGAADNAIGLLRLRAGRIGKAGAAFDRAAAVLAAAGPHEFFIRNRLYRGLIALFRADVAAAERLLDEARRSYCSHLLEDAELAAMIDVGEAAVLYEKGGPFPAGAQIGAARGALLAGDGSNIEFSSLACRIDAMLACRRQGPRAALGLLGAWLDLARGAELTRLERSLLAQKLHLAALAGDRALAAETKSALDRRFGPAASASQPVSGWRENAEQIFAEARFSIDCGRTDLARNALNVLDRSPSAPNVETLALKSEALRALALAADGEAAKATQALRGLLAQGERLGVRSFLLEEGHSAQRLLDEAARRYSKTKKAEEFNGLIVKWLVASSSYLPPDERIKQPALTARQRRILGLLIRRIDRKTAAEMAGTTTHNVDYHTKKLFDLFGVTSIGRLAAEAIRLDLADDAPQP